MDEMMARKRVVSGLALGFAVSLALCALMCVSPPASGALSADWQVEDAMSGNRTQAVVLQDDDGIIYVIGGVRSTSGGYGPEVGDVESFNPSTGEWTDLAQMPRGVRGAAGALGGDGRIYVFGGVNSSVIGSNMTQIYDPAADVWTSGAAVPLGVWEAKAASFGLDKLIVVGGEGAYTNTQIYDIAEDSWSAGGSLPGGVFAGVLLEIDYYCLYIGGSDPGYTALDTVYRYDKYYDIWNAGDPMPVPTAAHAAVIGPDGLIYVVGGADSAMNVGLGYNTSYCLNPSTGDWTQLDDIPVGVRYLGAATSADGMIYAFGGNDDTDAHPQVLSLHVMELTSSLSESEARAGDSITVTLTVEFANRGTVTGSDYSAYFVTPEGIPTNPVYAWISAPYPAIAIELDVPGTAEPGTYSVVVHWYTSTTSGGVELPVQELSLTVVDAPTLEEQLSEVLAQLDAMGSDINATEAALLEEVGALESELNALQSQLDALESAMAEADDDIQTSLDSKAENSILYAVIGLLVVVIVLLIVMMMMSRKRLESPPPSA